MIAKREFCLSVGFGLLLGLGLMASGCGKKAQTAIAGKTWREEHKSGTGGVISVVQATITTLNANGSVTLTLSGKSTANGTGNSQVQYGGTTATESAPATVTIPAGTLTGTVKVYDGNGNYHATKTLKYWSSFK